MSFENNNYISPKRGENMYVLIQAQNPVLLITLLFLIVQKL